MGRRSQILRIAKWTGAASTILILAALCLSFRWELIANDRHTFVGFRHGTTWVVRSARPELGWDLVIRRPYWTDYKREYLWPEDVLIDEPDFCGVLLPLWLPALAALLPTILLWFLDRRHSPGHCRCGYNLTGNTTGRCPECGSAVRV